MKSLTVLYDADCAFCQRVQRWLTGRVQLVPLEFVAAGSAAARAKFPNLDHAATLCDITVVSDYGEVFRGERAWLVCLWALAAYRGLAVKTAASTNKLALRAAMRVADQFRNYGEHHEGSWPGGACEVGKERADQGADHGDSPAPVP